MFRKRRVKGLNRRVFYSNLLKVLKLEYKENLKYNFDHYVDEYSDFVAINGIFGWYEVGSLYHKNGYAEQIRTN